MTDDPSILVCVELLLEERFVSLKAAAQTDEAAQHAAEFGKALAYIRERRQRAEEMERCLAPFVTDGE